QDLGAAGLTSSSSEMASKGEVGIDLDMAKVPLREADMEPFEIMISESQERMLCVVEPERLDAVLEVCEKWEVRATAIGQVTDGNRLRVFMGDELVGDMPVDVLVDDCPLYDLEPEKPAEPIYRAPEARIGPDDDVLLALLASPSIASKLWAFEQYDPLVGSRTVRRPAQAEAAVLHLMNDGGHGALAVAIEGNGRRVACDPYVGAAEAVLECAANLACVGAEPLGLTNCLNFGNPEKPHIAWQFTQAIDGLADACRALDTPVVGGNVSLYNEAPEGPVYPTPVVGMVGKLPDPEVAPVNSFTRPGLVVALAGHFTPALQGSELEKLRGRLSNGLVPVDLAQHARALAVLREATRSGLVAAAHDIAEGGLAVALAEMSIPARIGVRAAIDEDAFDTWAFGEGPGGVLLACAPEDFDALAAICADIPFVRLGETGGDAVVLEGSAASLHVQVEEAAKAYEEAVPSSFE
ncbi:MAG TPA: AIR synthase-related protein, partial [Thermoleophilaceae bacterium]